MYIPSERFCGVKYSKILVLVTYSTVGNKNLSDKLETKKEVCYSYPTSLFYKILHRLFILVKKRFRTIKNVSHLGPDSPTHGQLSEGVRCFRIGQKGLNCNLEQTVNTLISANLRSRFIIVCLGSR